MWFELKRTLVPVGRGWQCAFHGVLEPKRHRFLLEEGVERKIEYKHGAREPWSIERSIFAARKRESCAFYDTQRMINRMFDTDWARLAGKTLFRRNMIRGSKGLDNLKNSLRGVYNTILHAFDFYCAGGEWHARAFALDINNSACARAE